MQANGRLQRWNSKGLRPQGLVEAAARHGFSCSLEPWQTAGLNALRTEAMQCRQTAGCNAGTAKAYGQRGLGGSSREGLERFVLSVLANGRFEMPLTREGYEGWQTAGCSAGTRKA